MAKKILDFTTAAVTDGNQAMIKIKSSHFADNSQVLLAIKGLAGAETADLYVQAGDDWAPLGSSYQFSATVGAKVLPAAGTYGMIKSTTVSALEVWLHTGQN